MNSKKLLMKEASKISKLTEEFYQKICMDANGLPHRQEFGKLLVDIAKELGVDSPTPQEVDQILDQIDQNGNSRISKEDYQSLISIVIQVMRNEANS